MDKQPQQLIEARTILRKYETAIEERKGLFYLGDGLSLLEEVINGTFPEIYKGRAIEIRATYADRVISKIKGFLATKGSYEMRELVYWLETIDTLIYPQSEEVLHSLKTLLIEKWLEQKSIQELDKLLAESEEEGKRQR